MKTLFIVGLALAALVAAQPAHSQALVNPCTLYEGTKDSGNTTQNCVAVTASAPLPVISGGAAFTNITTATNTVVSAKPANFMGLTVNTGGAGSSATVYNNTTCTGSKIGTYDTSAAGTVNVGAYASTGICVTTAGGTPADITVLYR